MEVVVVVVVLVGRGTVGRLGPGDPSRVLPLLARDRRSLAYAPLVVLAPVAPVAVLLAIGALLTVGLNQIGGLVEFLRSPRALIAARVGLIVVGLVALPGWVAAVVDVAGRQP